MKISKLIEELQLALKVEGDIQVAMATDRGVEPLEWVVNDVRESDIVYNHSGLKPGRIAIFA